MGRDAVRVTVDALGAELKQTLTIWHEDVNAAIDKASQKAVKELVTKTKATAPKGARGRFRKNISSKEVPTGRAANRGKTYAWYVKAPDYRLTHLLVHGHAARDGGRVDGDPFLQNALDQVLPEYLSEVQEALNSGK